MESTTEVVSNIIADKSVCVEDLTENNEKVDEVKINVVKNIEPIEPEEIVAEEEEDESDEEEDDEEDNHQTITEEVIDNHQNGDQTNTITVTTVSNSTPGVSTKTVVTKSSVEKEQPVTTACKTVTATTEAEKTELSQNFITKEHDENEKMSEATKEENEGNQIDSEKTMNGLKKSEESAPQQLNTLTKTPGDPQNQIMVKEETVVDAPSTVPQTIQQQSTISDNQDTLNKTTKETATSLETGLKTEENIAALKQREFELIKKQQELAQEIEYQKCLAEKLAKENEMKQHPNNLGNQENHIRPVDHDPQTHVSSYSNFEETQDNNVYTRKSETFETRESTNVSKKIDLHKIFTPATDAEEILPKNRKLYASSAFYSPTLHPTVEDQVELARRISHSLSDISNQQSRGQSMYVNRKKRSVKWVHESCGQDDNETVKVPNEAEYDQEAKENEGNHLGKVPLKFLMNPSGQMRDINSLRESINTETGLLSPDVSAEVVTALQTQKGKGAELFAKRRKVSEKWVVDESNVGAQSPSGLPDYHQYQQQPKPPTSPSILPAYTDAAKHRVQLNLHQEHLLEKYAKPSLKVVQTPWEAAITSGSASAAFVEEQKLSPYPISTPTPSLTPQLYDASYGGGLSHQSAPSTPNSCRKTYTTDAYQKFPMYTAPQQQAPLDRQQYTGSNAQRELAYKPSIPQGWKAPSMSLPKDLYMPKEIPLQSYAPPPVSSFTSHNVYETKPFVTYEPFETSVNESAPAMPKSYGGTGTFPISKPQQQGFLSTYGYSQPPKQQYLPPESYKKVPQNTSQNVPQVNFNPSPLPYEKLAKFENPPVDDGRYINSPPSRGSYLNVSGSKVRHMSPAVFDSSADNYYYGGTPSASPRPLSNKQQYHGQNISNPSYSNKILYAPSYNTSARGWGCNAGAYSCAQSHIKPQMVNAASMPYTDF